MGLHKPCLLLRIFSASKAAGINKITVPADINDRCIKFKAVIIDPEKMITASKEPQLFS